MEVHAQLLNGEQRQSLAELFGPYGFVIAAYQFGSTVRGGAGPLSDLDIALLLNQGAPSGLALARLEGLLAYRVGRVLDNRAREVDVVSLNRCPLLFQHSVLRNGRVVYDGDPVARRLYEWQVIRAYLSFEPTLRWMGQFQKEGWLRRCGLR